MTAAIKILAQQIASLNEQAYHSYAPLVEETINSKTSNQKQIEHLLDGLLDFCGTEKILSLFKKLCRYYWKINPNATAEYVNIYRKLWDSEEEQNS